MMLPKNELLVEWINKAEGDFEAALHLYKSRVKKAVHFIIAFHCQQSIEKYLKALLIGLKISFPKTHDLVKLLELIGKKEPLLAGIRKELSSLNPYAIEFRYPGDDIDRSELIKIVTITKKLRNLLLKRIREYL